MWYVQPCLDISVVDALMEFSLHCSNAEVETVSTGVQQHRAELTPVWPSVVEKSHFSLSVMQVSKDGGEGNHSYPVSVHTDPQRLMLIHPHMTKTEKREARPDRGKKKCFSLHLRSCGKFCQVTILTDRVVKIPPYSIIARHFNFHILTLARRNSLLCCQRSDGEASWICC